MRGKARWASPGTLAVFVALSGCGGDDEHTFEDGGPDSGDARGRGGAAGSDAGRADTNAGGGGSSGAAGSSGGGGTSDAGPDRSSDGQVGADADGTSVADRAIDRVDGNGNSVLDGLEEPDGPPPDDARDALEVDVRDGGDVASIDSSADADAPAADASDASNATDATDATDAAFVDTSDAALCDDGNAASIDFYSPTYGCGHKFDANPGDSDAWITYDAGFHVDVATALGWAFPAGSRSASAAATECDAFSVAGLTNWRMATIDEARSLADGCAPTKAGGSCPLDDPGCLTFTCGLASPACSSCSASGGPHAGQYCKVDVAVCTYFHTSSACSDCTDATATDWIYIPINGNFFSQPSGAGIPTACVSVVPNGVPPSDGG